MTGLLLAGVIVGAAMFGGCVGAVVVGVVAGGSRAQRVDVDLVGMSRSVR